MRQFLAGGAVHAVDEVVDPQPVLGHVAGARGTDVLAVPKSLPGDQPLVVPVALAASWTAAINSAEHALAIVALGCALGPAQLAELNLAVRRGARRLDEFRVGQGSALSYAKRAQS